MTKHKTRPASPWQKIETAPKGKLVLVDGHNEWYGPVSARLERFHPNQPGKMRWRAAINGYKLEPTHWMPIPPLPEGER